MPLYARPANATVPPSGNTGKKKPRTKRGSIEKIKKKKEEIHPIIRFLDKPGVQSFVMLCTLWAIFVDDVVKAWFSKRIDYLMGVITLAVLVIFCAEIVCQVKFKPGYTFSFFFWLDFLGTVSLLPEIMILFNEDNAANLQTGNVTQNHLVDIFSRLRAARLMRLARIVRVVRLVKIIRRWHARSDGMEGDSLEDEDSVKNKSSKIGLAFADLVSKRVVVGVLLVLLTPDLFIFMRPVPLYLEVSTVRVNELELLDMFEPVTSDELYKQQIDAFLEKNPHTLHLKLGGTVYKDGTAPLAERRMSEVSVYSSEDTDTMVVYDESEGESILRQRALLLTLFIMGIFQIGSHIFNKDADTYLIQPIQRMSTLVEKLAGTLYVLEDHEHEEDGMETNFIESVVERMADVFDVGEEKKKSAAVQPAATDKFEMETTKGNRWMDFTEPETDGYAELSNFGAAMQSEEFIQYFRTFLIREFNVENLAFWEEAEKYRVNMEHDAIHMFKSFIAETAPTQVNVPDSMRIAISRSYDKDPTSRLFHEAQLEVFGLMREDAYPRFLKSEFVEPLREELGKKEMVNKIRQTFAQKNNEVRGDTGVEKNPDEIGTICASKPECIVEEKQNEDNFDLINLDSGQNSPSPGEGR